MSGRYRLYCRAPGHGQYKGFSHSGRCPVCEEEKDDRASAKLEGVDDGLTGSLRQRAWAVDIRSRAIGIMDGCADIDARVRAAIARNVDAKWWIDRREGFRSESGVRTIARAMVADTATAEQSR